MYSNAISRRRRARDRAASFAINGAGVAVIALIFLILAYLLSVTLPLARNAGVLETERISLDPSRSHAVSAANGRLWLLPEPEAERATSIRSSGRQVLRVSAGRMQLFELPDRLAVSGASLPEAVLQYSLPLHDAVVRELAFDSGSRRALAAWLDASGTLQVSALPSALNPLELGQRAWSLSLPDELDPGAARIFLDADRSRVLLIAGTGFLRWQLALDGRLESQRSGLLFDGPGEASITAWGPDYETLLLIDSMERLWRFDPADPMFGALGAPRQLGSPTVWLGSESERRVSYRLADDGMVSSFVPTSGSTLLSTALEELDASAQLGVSEDGTYLYSLGGAWFVRYTIANPYPETGWSSLWQKQWYGGYAQPAFAWQPDGAAIGVLSKLSLTPLLWGTFKAALYGMLIAIPLAIGAAVYTGYFLAPRTRNRIKPAIEMLEAFPTVVLGFIAGLWLAPLLLDYLLAILLLPLLLLLLPLILSLTQLLLQTLSTRFQRRPARIAILLLIYTPLVLLLLWQGNKLEMALLGVPVRDWLWSVFGVSYEQRNALLVGMAMGVAIMPAMFSIMEDAIHAVPRSLSDGSLALGATRWQSLARVVLPAASPAILSALLIGLARGLGETMIVLLATGNSPLTDASLFSGLRSLSASIAIELPEAGSSSVQFRLLFLAALVLFGLTFLFNTLAEILRQRLRYSYAGL